MSVIGFAPGDFTRASFRPQGRAVKSFESYKEEREYVMDKKRETDKGNMFGVCVCVCVCQEERATEKRNR